MLLWEKLPCTGYYPKICFDFFFSLIGFISNLDDDIKIQKQFTSFVVQLTPNDEKRIKWCFEEPVLVRNCSLFTFVEQANLRVKEKACSYSADQIYYNLNPLSIMLIRL